MAWASAPGATLEFQVNGAAVEVADKDAGRVIEKVEKLVDSANYNSETSWPAGPRDFSPWTPVDALKAHSFLHVAYPEPKGFPTVGGLVTASDVWIELSDGDKPGGKLPGPVTLISGGRPVYLTKMSGVQVIELGIDPALLDHLPGKMREELARDAIALEKYIKSTAAPAPQDSLATDPTGMWKGFTAYHGEVLLVHPIFMLDFKDGRLTGKEITQDPNGTEEETPLLNPAFKNGVVTFDVRVPSDQERASPFGNAGGGISRGFGGGMGGGGRRGRRGGGRSAGGGSGSGGFGTAAEASDVSGGPNGGYVSYVGNLMGATIVGSHTKSVMGNYGMDATEATWIAMRITPTGIWDVTMKILPSEGEAHDKDSPLRSVNDELMKFEFKDLALSGTWKRTGADGRPVPEPIDRISLNAQGVAFSVAVDGPAGKTVYDFKGEFMGSIADEAIHSRPTITIGPRGPQVNDPGSSIDMIAGTLRITGPDGKVYTSNWRAVRDNGKRARVEMGTPYEVKGPQAPPLKP
jgi:hypothetical protein